jgi:hypothetical protein
MNPWTCTIHTNMGDFIVRVDGPFTADGWRWDLYFLPLCGGDAYRLRGSGVSTSQTMPFQQAQQEAMDCVRATAKELLLGVEGLC